MDNIKSLPVSSNSFLNLVHKYMVSRYLFVREKCKIPIAIDFRFREGKCHKIAKFFYIYIIFSKYF